MTLATGNVLNHLMQNTYPGRGLIVGLDKGGDLIQVYWIMGRSEKSRNRRFCVNGGTVKTEIVDPAQVAAGDDTSLILYNAMAEAKSIEVSSYTVSNGSQTDDVTRRIKSMALVYALKGYAYEPDAPNFTPRITAVCQIPLLVEICIIRRSPWGKSCDIAYYSYQEIDRGFGHCVTTYMGDGSPLPAFHGEPLLMPLSGTFDDIAENYWATLNPDNRVSLVVKKISMETGESQIRVINKHGDA